MKESSSVRFYVEVCNYWQARVSRDEFWAVVNEILQDRLYAEFPVPDSCVPKVPIIVVEFHVHRPDGLIHTDYYLEEVIPYEPTGKDAYMTYVYMDYELIEVRM